MASQAMATIAPGLVKQSSIITARQLQQMAVPGIG